MALITTIGVAGLTGCDSRREPPTAPPTPAPAGPEADGLKVGDCVAPKNNNAVGYREVWCSDPAALAKIEEVADTGRAGLLATAACPANTDIVLNTFDFAQPLTGSNQGTACARNLKPPHPGDPGNGGGEIGDGDCVYLAGTLVQETECGGSKTQETYKIYRMSASLLAEKCDKASDLSFTMSSAGGALGGLAVCARRVTG